jgi:glucosylceramidase
MKRALVILAGIMIITAIQAQTQRKSSPPREKRKISVTITAQNTSFRLARQQQQEFKEFPQPFEYIPCVFVDTTREFQTFVGIGAALTDASAETFAKLPQDKQAEFLRLYFNKEKGIGYTIARTNMNSCDFSSDMYTYTDSNDIALNTFSIAHDEKYKIPLIKKAIEAADGDLKLFVSPWSPPAWMKGNHNMLQGGSLDKAYFQPWANYFVKFIKAYEADGIPVWGLTVQNEPMAKQTWESCIYTAEQERDFIKNFLGPTLWKNDLKDKKLIAWDHNRDQVYHRASTILNDPEAAKYVWGIGFHWYESWTGAPTPENVRLVHEAFPGTYLMLTEACNYPFSWDTFDDWKWGENYGAAMISDFNNGASAWTDWNILLDETGGPNHVKNFCFAPMHADLRDGTLHIMNSFFYIGHFSKFIQPGAKRIACSSSRAQLMTTAFKNPDGTCAVIVMNQGETEVKFRLYVENQASEVTSLPHSIMTLGF